MAKFWEAFISKIKMTLFVFCFWIKKKYRVHMLASGEFQTSFFDFSFSFSSLQTSLSPCAFLTPFPRNPYVSSQVLELVWLPLLQII